MTRENFFKKVVVKKGNHFSMFCDNDADFVIFNNNSSVVTEYPMCKKCAELFKNKIESGIDM